MLLDTQYRMHPAISLFPNSRFYEGRLIDGVQDSARFPPPTSFVWPVQAWPIAYVEVEGFETNDGSSKFNEAQAAATTNIVVDLLRRLFPRLTRLKQDSTSPTSLARPPSQCCQRRNGAGWWVSA